MGIYAKIHPYKKGSVHMNNYADEIRADIRSSHGERFAPSKPSANYKKEISDANAIYNAMTQEERDSILYLKDNNFTELQALYNRVKERAGL
jgi:hypothetical protein